jgi:hypothetical protein
MPAKRHVHKYYYGLEISGSKVWACALPDCNHFMPKHMEGLVMGRRSICWKCGEETVIIDNESRKELKPICDECKLVGQLDNKPIAYSDAKPITSIAQEHESIVPPSTVELCIKCGARPRNPLNPDRMCSICAVNSIELKGR